MRAKHLFVTITLLLLLSSIPCAAQDALTKSVDEVVQQEMTRQRIPGVSLAVVKNGQVVLAKGYGFANLEHKVSVVPETIFQSGSIGKQFTATAVMMLVADGKLALDDKIGKYLGAVPEAWSTITIRHLLTHTSGLTDYPDDFDFRRDYTEDELLKRAQAITPAFKPGEKWQYSNLAYVTLGILIHKVSGQFYGDFLQERVFKPLGMNTTRIISEADIVPNRAAGYIMVKNEIKNQNWVSPTLNTTADGALYLTSLDLAKWDAALYGEKLLKPDLLQQMWTTAKLNNNKTTDYGFGWALGQINGHRLVQHGGAWQGFTSFIARYVDDKLTVIVLDNLAGGNAGLIAHRVALLYNPQLARKPITDTEPQVTAHVKELLQNLAEGNADQNQFSPAFRSEFFPAQAERIGRVLKAQGPPKSILLVERREKDGDRIYVYEVTYATRLRYLKVTFDGDKKLTGFVGSDY